MTFIKGNTKGKGRIKGSKNTATDSVRKAFEDLISNNLENMQKDIDKLEPKDRLHFIEKLSAYIIPKLKQVELEEEVMKQEIAPFRIQDIYNTKDEDLDNA
jgi:hypothetical protein